MSAPVVIGQTSWQSVIAGAKISHLPWNAASEVGLPSSAISSRSGVGRGGVTGVPAASGAGSNETDAAWRTGSPIPTITTTPSAITSTVTAPSISLWPVIELRASLCIVAPSLLRRTPRGACILVRHGAFGFVEDRSHAPPGALGRIAACVRPRPGRDRGVAPGAS